MVEKYDIVHIGIFFLLIANNDPEPILKSLMKLLSECIVRSASVICVCMARYLGLTRKAEPGGYLQWDELDWAGRRIVRADPSLPKEDMQKLLDYVSKWEDALGLKS